MPTKGPSVVPERVGSIPDLIPSPERAKIAATRTACVLIQAFLGETNSLSSSTSINFEELSMWLEDVETAAATSTFTQEQRDSLPAYVAEEFRLIDRAEMMHTMKRQVKECIAHALSKEGAAGRFFSRIM